MFFERRTRLRLRTGEVAVFPARCRETSASASAPHMRVVFMGTPEFAATILDDLVEQHDVVAAVHAPRRGARPRQAPELLSR